jgi:hypothetical protein
MQLIRFSSASHRLIIPAIRIGYRRYSKSCPPSPPYEVQSDDGAIGPVQEQEREPDCSGLDFFRMVHELRIDPEATLCILCDRDFCNRLAFSNHLRWHWRRESPDRLKARFEAANVVCMFL